MYEEKEIKGESRVSEQTPLVQNVLNVINTKYFEEYGENAPKYTRISDGSSQEAIDDTFNTIETCYSTRSVVINYVGAAGREDMLSIIIPTDGRSMDYIEMHGSTCDGGPGGSAFDIRNPEDVLYVISWLHDFA